MADLSEASLSLSSLSLLLLLESDDDDEELESLLELELSELESELDEELLELELASTVIFILDGGICSLSESSSVSVGDLDFLPSRDRASLPERVRSFIRL
jgi:hypothetical protein